MNNDVFKKLSDLELLTLCMYGEARNQGLDGMLAVGSVVMNRARRPNWWGHDIKSVALKDWQFSCFNRNDPNRSTLENIAHDFDENLSHLGFLRQCYWIAKGIMEGFLPSNVGKATHYHTTQVTPEWKGKLKFINQVGSHLFYLEG